MNRTPSCTGFLALLVCLSLLVATVSCGSPTPVEPIIVTSVPLAPSLVILSPLGEVTRDARFVGEEIRYRIYYSAPGGGEGALTIQDRLDPRLSFVSASNGGSYDDATHTVTWSAEGSSYVELDATSTSAGTVQNRVALNWSGGTLETNTTEIVVCEVPRPGWQGLMADAVEGQQPVGYMKDETTTGLLVNFDLPGFYVTEEKVEGQLWHRLSVPGHSSLRKVGAPELPLLGEIVEVPKGVNFSVEIELSEMAPVGCYNVWPAQEPQIRQTPTPASPFALDAGVYTNETLYPGSLAGIEAEDIGIVRGHRLVLLKAYPLQYNPVTREMQAYRKLEVRIRYDNTAQMEAIDRRLLSPAFEELLEAATLNHRDAERYDRGTAGSEEKSGADYLILAEGRFINASDPNNPLERLRAWKQQKGWLTRIVDPANIPGFATAPSTEAKAASIEAYVRTAYATWDPAPTYVLLVGDSDLVPPTYRTQHPSHNNTKIGTDLYYAAVDGTDYWPDLFIGRLPVSAMQELTDVVDKIINYEQNPPAAAGFYMDTPLVMLFEDDTDPPPTGVPSTWVDSCPEDGQEDCTFRIIERAEAERSHLLGLNYNVERIYAHSGNWPQGPQRYENGTTLPDELLPQGNPDLGIPGFPWNGGTGDIQNAINNGAFLVTYDGHGGRQEWGLPAFNVGDVTRLTNGAMTPVVISWACQTGWFDNEKDDPSLGTADGDESLMETFLLQPSNGAVAAIGSTRISTDLNDTLMDGAARALWPDFPVFATGGRLPRLGQLLNYAKLYMAGKVVASADRLRHFEMYHLFGDPEMPIWTAAPGRLEVAHPDGIGSTGMQEFAVTVLDAANKNPVRNATVTLTRSGAIVDMHQTDPAGIVRFRLNSPMAQPLALTVTAYDYRPYLGVIDVSGGGAELNRLDPANGPQGQVIRVGGTGFSSGEQVQIRLDGVLGATTAASSGSFGQVGGTDVTVTVPSPHSPGPVNVTATGVSSGHHAARLFEVRTANATDPFTYDQSNTDTWTLHPGDNPTWNNPEIQLYRADTGDPIESGNLIAGETYLIKVRVHNDTDFDANGATVTFKWADYGLGQPFEEIGPDPVVVVDLPAHTVTEVEHKWTPQATGHLCVQAEIYHIEDVNPGNNVGQENCHVGAASSPADVTFLVCNPTEEATAVFLEVRQIDPAPDVEHRPWAVWVKHPNPQVLKPGECRQALVVVDPDVTGAKSGEQAEFAITGFAGGRIIGGVNFVVSKR